MVLNFTKMHGLGNDYIYIDCIKNKCSIPNSDIPKICDRHFGVGSDGIIFIENSNIADFKMKMFNADGSEAQMCGNGIRCLGKFVYDNGYTDKTSLSIETLCGIKTLKLYIQNSKVEFVQVDMGEPCFDTKKIPMKLQNNKLKLVVVDKVFDLEGVSIGNPHAITVVKDVNLININKYGPIIENDINFPDRTNVEFVEILDKDNIKMRVWERGTGETLACGTGACASCVICNKQNYTNNKVTVHLLGGNLDILWDKSNNHIYMKGPATTVFEGKIEI